MKTANRHGSPSSSGRLGGGPLAVFIAPALKGIAITGLSGSLLWLVWIYASGLRDPRFLDGWILAGGMSLQLYLHIARRLGRMTPRSALRWRRAHIVLGYLLIVVFLSHSEFSLPETIFEWALWGSFVMLALSGIFGTYLAWTLQRKHDLAEGIAFDRIPHLCAGLAEKLHATVHAADPAAMLIPLPPLPHEDWIKRLYHSRLHDFFSGPRNLASHFIGSRLPLHQICNEIDNLSRYVDHRRQADLAAIMDLVREKDRLDFARVHLGLTRAWLLVHVPVTYVLIVLTVMHVIASYSFSSGAG